MAASVFLVLIIIYLAIGVAYFSSQRGWNVVDCVYFSVLTLTTIGALSLNECCWTLTGLTTGYGDLTPKSDGQKIFTIFYVLVGFCILGDARPC